MASLPSQASWRRQSSIEQSNQASASSNDASEDTTERIGQLATTSSQNTLNEKPSHLEGSTPETGVTVQTNADSSTSPADQAEPRHCWICLTDEGDEEAPDTRDWRSPCPCNLQAHEECMLEWIADLEALDISKGRPPPKILCPQCKAEIKIARPLDIIVSLVSLVRSFGRILVLPAGLSALFGCLYSGSMAYGVNAVCLVFGKEEAHALLSSSEGKESWLRKALTPFWSRWQAPILESLKITDPFMPFTNAENAKVFFYMPLIAPALILSRTRLADHAFAVLPISFFAYRPRDYDIRRWPPSPAFALALIPYFRAAYVEVYKHIFSDLEKKWDQAVQRRPREGETAEQVAQEQRANMEEDQIQIEIELNVGNAMPRQLEEANPLPAAADQADPNNQDPGAAQPNGQPAQGQNQAREFLLPDTISAAGIASTVMGALFFPAVSSLMGDLLKVSLPRAWVTKPASFALGKTLRHGTGAKISMMKGMQATGLLQEKWGRSLVGGALFVVLKDALILYWKWKRARMQGKRRVLDYVRP